MGRQARRTADASAPALWSSRLDDQQRHQGRTGEPRCPAAAQVRGVDLVPDGVEGGALDRVQEAAQIFRRSGVQVELASDDERRIFAAVVRPERARVDDKREAEVERLRAEVARAEGMLANERFVANAPAEVVDAEREKLERYRRELAALGGM